MQLPIQLPVLSQLDPRWKDNRLGTGNTTIDQAGCALACIGMVSGQTDLNVLNNALINNEGYAQGNLMYWLKVPNSCPNLTFVYRDWKYDNNIVKDWIYNKGLPVIVQVDAAPIGNPGGIHFVVYVGNQLCCDPWTGKIRPTSDFPNPQGSVRYTIEATPLTLDEKIKFIIYSNDSDNIKVQKVQALLPKQYHG